MHIGAKVGKDRVFFCDDKAPKVRKTSKSLALIRLESISVSAESNIIL